ncbi:hypothetical protein HK101_011784 [Irineochytrium annulatum]|nr:hypothetical protein HK101_011784 [Irineochytrium annulatum]
MTSVSSSIPWRWQAAILVPVGVVAIVLGFEPARFWLSSGARRRHLSHYWEEVSATPEEAAGHGDEKEAHGRRVKHSRKAAALEPCVDDGVNPSKAAKTASLPSPPPSPLAASSTCVHHCDLKDDCAAAVREPSSVGGGVLFPTLRQKLYRSLVVFGRFVNPWLEWEDRNTGQSTCLVQLDGYNILTDPIFSSRTVGDWLGPKRVQRVPCQIQELPKIDIVLVSHNHYDHLDQSVVAYLGNSAVWYIPVGLRSWFANFGVTNVVELDWWAEAEHEDKDLHRVIPRKKLRVIGTPIQVCFAL